jgi:hypothetical protein
MSLQTPQKITNASHTGDVIGSEVLTIGDKRFWQNT